MRHVTHRLAASEAQTSSSSLRWTFDPNGAHGVTRPTLRFMEKKIIDALLTCQVMLL
ncbi:MAG TPA: hypothetical protein VFR76_08820 [Verrucomicrobiae bacterium]|nr:hypothetical protein [Verrucomicrobiae bacterium]